MWSDSPSTLQHDSLFWNIQCDLLLFKHDLLVRTNSGSSLSVLSINSLQLSSKCYRSQVRYLLHYICTMIILLYLIVNPHSLLKYHTNLKE